MTNDLKILIRRNFQFAKTRYGRNLSALAGVSLRALTERFLFSMELGELLLLEGSWYVTHSGLLRLANHQGCIGIHVMPVPRFCEPEKCRWAFRATAFRNSSCKGFSGYGDANPNNVSATVRGAEMRVAETRAVNRALRKAYGIGICSVEEIGSFSPGPEPAAAGRKVPQTAQPSEHPLRERLLVLVRQHQLDASLVKLYAADFCGVEEIREAGREQVRTFIDHLSQEARNDPDALRERLAKYQKAEAGAA